MEKEFSNPHLITFMRLRKSIGFLAIFFPLILIIYAWSFGNCRTIQAAVSDYYYTASGDIFIGVIFAISFFLIAYKGYDRMDQWLTNTAGICSVLISLLPTGQNEDVHCTMRFVTEFEWRTTAHNLLAILFFLILAYMSYFQFTKSAGIMTAQKIDRNKVYRICSIIMVAALLLIPVFSALPIFPKVIFWMEWVALAAFGFSWLTKGGFILVDKMGDKKVR
ncbi:hypothetical protein M3O96_20715 [Aquiflexum sp. TKW24L]|uniref:hypothetical protein n=1 Tax=Aquiflexum sp. TKW24L TaxID=2942212 RepID=UPI0020BF1176|nr:hypothetical protein [Aquiflexum sp. TKW24L]MCL6261535.1 hypothetical protein [Aquiflexum sp. TKW24L]